MGRSLGCRHIEPMYLSAVVLCLILAGCAAGAPGTLGNGAARVSPTGLARQLPWPGSSLPVTHQSSANTEIVLTGEQYSSKSDNAVPDVPNKLLRLIAGPQEPSWGVYGFDGVSEADPPVSLEIELTEALPQEYFIGIADYGRMAWQWLRVDAPTGDDSIDIPTDWQVISPAGVVYAAVATWDGQSATLSRLTLHLETPTVIISSYDIQALGATGGTGAGGDIFAEGDQAAAVANQALTLQLNAVEGTWLGEHFDAATFPGTMTAADYDTIKAAVADALGWTFANQGAAEARYTAPWFLPAAAYSGAGDPGAGFICPDDDPESSGAYPEGECALNLSGAISSPDPNIIITADTPVSASIGFELIPDPAAPMIEGYYNDPAFTSPLTQLQTGAGVTTVFFKMTSWGASGAMLPADGASCKLQLIQVVGNDAAATPFDLTWYSGGGYDPGAGEFCFYHAPPPVDIDVFICKVPGMVLTASAFYAMRFFDGATWSTINLPSTLLATQAGPPGWQDLLTLPKVYGRNFSSPHMLQIFYNEPKIRRDSRFELNLVSGTASPLDSVAYADILKDPSSSGEFPVSLKPVIIGGHPGYAPYPAIVIAETTTADPIDPYTLVEDDPRGIPDITIPLSGGRESGRLSVDISALILALPPPVAGDPPLTYCYKVIGQAFDVGCGYFAVPSDPIDLNLLVGVDWGINIGDRGDWNKVDFNLLAWNKAVDGSTMTTSTPDVFWVRFNGGTRVLAWNEYWSGGGGNNFQLVLENVTNPAQMWRGLSVVAVGVTANNDYIAIHHFNRHDGSSYVDWAAAFPSDGILNPGDVYNVMLDDPTSGGIDWTFPDQLSVIGTNPNY